MADGSGAGRVERKGRIAPDRGGEPLASLWFTTDTGRDDCDVLHADGIKVTKFDKVMIQDSVFKNSGKTYQSAALTKDDFAVFKAAYAKAVAE